MGPREKIMAIDQKNYLTLFEKGILYFIDEHKFDPRGGSVELHWKDGRLKRIIGPPQTIYERERLTPRTSH